MAYELANLGCLNPNQVMEEDWLTIYGKTNFQNLYRMKINMLLRKYSPMGVSFKAPTNRMLHMISMQEKCLEEELALVEGCTKINTCRFVGSAWKMLISPGRDNLTHSPYVNAYLGALYETIPDIG